jgi:hypothetical protein
MRDRRKKPERGTVLEIHPPDAARWVLTPAGGERWRAMYQYDPGFSRQLHAERVAALRADYALRVEQPRPEPRVGRTNRSIRLAWVSALGMRAIWLLAAMVPIGVVAVGIKAAL